MPSVLSVVVIEKVEMKLVMMGTGLFAEPTFEALLASSHPVVGLVTQPDRVTGDVRGSTRQTGKGMKDIALAHNIPVYQPESINTPEGVAQLKAWQPDLLVVAAYGQILARDVLEAAPRGGINVHASLLPKYRGAAPIHWAIYHGEKETGVTIIRMSTALDAGDMLAQEAIPIGPDDTSGEMEARLSTLGAWLAMQIIEKLANGNAEGLKQDKGLVTKAPKLTKEHGLIDWTRSAAQIQCHIRAMQPWPTAYTFLHRPGQTPTRAILFKSTATDIVPDNALPPGALFMQHQQPSTFFVVTGAVGSDSRHALQVHELQPAGKKRMSAGDFLRGNLIQPGMFFGPETI